jgi:osmoprotectant transport system substrate-binding protein
MTIPRSATALGALALTGVLLAGCATDPFATSGDDDATIVIGSQDYYSNEIIAEIYAQALEAAGYTVDRQFRIGQREIYVPEIEAGAIDLFPEYTGPILSYWNPDTEARLAEDVYTELLETVPDGIRALDQSPATDQDAYTVTRAFAEEWDLSTIEDLTKVTVPLILGGNSEGENRSNGPRGLREVYGVEVDFTPIEDGGGPLTVKALQDGDIQLAIIYTADPSIEANDLVSLEDNRGLLLASHVVPLASEDIDDAAAEIINAIGAAMTAAELVTLNGRSVTEQLSPAVIAADWLAAQGLV